GVFRWGNAIGVAFEVGINLPPRRTLERLRVQRILVRRHDGRRRVHNGNRHAPRVWLFRKDRTDGPFLAAFLFRHSSSSRRSFWMRAMCLLMLLTKSL